MVNISKLGDSAIKFTFTNNDRYLYNGEITVPLNSLILVLDESDMAVLKKIDGDVFLTFLISNSNFSSKSDLEEWFKENACGSTGGGGVTSGEVETMIETSLEDYYDIDEVDAALSAKANTATTYSKTEVDTALAAKANTATTYTKTEVDNALSGKADTSAVTAVANDVTVLSGAIDNAKAYYIDFGVLSTQGIHDADWDGLVAAINARRPIYAGLPGTNGLLYYTAECLYQDGSNIIRMTASDNSAHYFYTFQKNGSENYSFSSDTRPYTTQAEKTAWNAVSGKVETSAITSAITSASTNAEVAGAKAVYDAIQAGGGGGATYSAGTNISISNDTINCTLPISASNSTIIIKNGSNNISSDNNFSQVFGSGNTINAYGGYNQHCITVEGINNSCGTQATHVEGGYNRGIAGSYSHVEGAHNTLSISNSPYAEVCSHVEGKYNKVLNYSEHASGQYNNSVSGSSTFGDSGNTLFSVGNGTADNARHNAFEIRQNGDIYIALNGQDVKLQDQLGGGSITVDSALDATSENPVQNKVIYAAIGNIESLLSNI